MTCNPNLVSRRSAYPDAGTQHLKGFRDYPPLMGIVEKKMETTIMGYIGIIGYNGESNGKENGQ